MITSLTMPSLSPTMEEGSIAKWHIKVGDFVEQGTLLCSIETDKTTVDYESLDEGYLRQIIVKEGESARVNKLIAILTDSKDEDFAADLNKAKVENDQRLSTSAAPIPQTGTNISAPTPAPVIVPVPTAKPSVSSPIPPYSPTPQISRTTTAAIPESDSIKASPLARKIAREKGIPLAQILGSGPGGRIVKENVENWVAPLAPINAGSNTSVANRKPTDLAPLYGSLVHIAPAQDVPLNQMRKIIGTRLLQSYQGAPAFFVGQKFTVDALLNLREQLNKHPGYKISINDLMVKCIALALRQVPKINASFQGEFIRYNDRVDISVAVAIPDGLITPIVRDADSKALGQISHEVKLLAAKATAGTLAPEEFQGGSFTISNLGMYGVTRFTSILNPPQAAILAVAGIQDELYRDANGNVADRKVMECTLTADHRVIDGALAAQFMQALKNLVENPTALML